MNFREFLEKEEMDLIAEELELNPHLLDDLEQYDEILGSALKFAAGAGGNLVSQLGRGAGNLVAGAAQGAYGAGQAAAGTLQMASGGRQTGWDRAKKGFGNLWSGGKKVARGAAQAGAAVTGVSPALRGAQAMAEPMGLSGVYAPAGKGRNAAQDLLGLNAWKGQNATNASGPISPPPLPPQTQKAPKARAVQQTPKQIQTQQTPASNAGGQTAANPDQTGRAAKFRDLVAQYNKTRDPSIRNRIMTEFPREYQAALIRSKGARGARMAQAAREQRGRTTRVIGTATT